MTLQHEMTYMPLRRSIPALTLLLGTIATAAHAQTPARVEKEADPRVGLGTGWLDAKSAARNLQLVSHTDKASGFVDPKQPGAFQYANSDLAFRGTDLFQGSFNGFTIWSIANPAKPVLRAAVTCPGGQGDPSVYRNLLFISVEQTNGRLDCGTQGVTDSVSADRFRGVRIFDISDLAHPKQIAAVQTCRGSHTHTLVTDPKDTANLYVYVSGTSVVRPGAELAGCSGGQPGQDPNTALFRIDVIKVPLAAPQTASIVSSPRIFADPSGNVAGLFPGSATDSAHTTAQTNQCHDITVYPQLGIAAGACAGNGILLDIRDPANPNRIAEASDPNFAYWHSATFNNDGTKVLFSDEWGGGTQARCRATDRPQWGADAIYAIGQDRKMTPAGYFKLPAAQTDAENCVAHHGSLIPVPGRDNMVQAWYQGGVSVFDFTDAAHPKEIAFFDRGPMTPELTLGGFWSAYWYNGHVIASEIGRGLDIFSLTPSADLSQNEIDAAKLVHVDYANIQEQQRIEWPASFVVARAYLDQLVRGNGLPRATTTRIARDLGAAEKLQGAARRTALTQLVSQLERDAEGASDATRVRALAGAVTKLVGATR
jgi:hypothetical protein